MLVYNLQWGSIWLLVHKKYMTVKLIRDPDGVMNDEFKAAIEMKEAAWKNVLRAKDEIMKNLYMEIYKEKMRRVKRCIYKNKKRIWVFWMEDE